MILIYFTQSNKKTKNGDCLFVQKIPDSPAGEIRLLSSHLLGAGNFYHNQRQKSYISAPPSLLQLFLPFVDYTAAHD